jgi:hypothetical protein
VATQGEFGVTPEGRLGEPSGARRVVAQGPVAQPTTKCKCYLTTAACAAAGLPDDCPELTLMRWYRDHVLLSSPSGRREVEHYYRTAPGIVAAIDALPDRRAAYARILAAGIRPAAAAVARGEHAEAYRIYRALHDELCGRFLPAVPSRR